MFSGSPQSSDAPDLQLWRYGLDASERVALPSGISAVAVEGEDTVANVASALDNTYCGSMSVEFDNVEVRVFWRII